MNDMEQKCQGDKCGGEPLCCVGVRQLKQTTGQYVLESFKSCGDNLQNMLVVL